MTVVEGVMVRALASGTVAHFKDARGQLALKLEADDGTNYYYADLSRYVGAPNRRVKAGEAIAKSTRQAAPERRAGEPQSKGTLPVLPVFVGTAAEPTQPQRTWVKLVPIQPPPPAPGVVRAPERRRIPAIAYVAGIGALAALIYALSRPPKRPKKRAGRRKR